MMSDVMRVPLDQNLNPSCCDQWWRASEGLKGTMIDQQYSLSTPKGSTI